MKIDRSILPPGFQQEKKEGRYVSFHPDGSVAHFAYYVDGEPYGWHIDLEPARMWGRGERLEMTVSEFPNDYEDYQEEGSDATTTGPARCDEEDYHEWVSAMVAEVEAIAEDFEADRHVMRCSFCGKRNSEVKKIIAGPACCICDECVALCNETLEEEGVTTPAPGKKNEKK